MCAGAGGEALGLEQAGFAHRCLIEVDRHACATLLANRPNWPVVQQDLAAFDARPFQDVTVVSGGLPCPPYSVAGKRLGSADHRDLFPHGLRIVDKVRPEAVMLENVKGMLHSRFDETREAFLGNLRKLGYATGYKVLNASQFGVPQLRFRLVIVAMRPRFASRFSWPSPLPHPAPDVGTALVDLMGARGWAGAGDWARNAAGVAPTLVGGSRLHGGADLGPTGARRAWDRLGVDGRSIADEAPGPGYNGTPRLTTRMTARLQGFPDEWTFSGPKTATYRQIANAFPPPVAEAVGRQISAALA